MLSGNQITIPDKNILLEIRCISKENNPKLASHPIIWEDQWIEKRPIIESRILSVLGKTQRIHGRETKVIKLTQPEANQFLNQNHLLGTTTAKTKLGLIQKDNVVAVATFSKPTKMDRNGVYYQSYEMIRYCTLNGFTVVGGLSKLISHFIGLVKPDDIMTYVDREWSKGKGYEKLGFKMVEQTPPQEFWIDPKEMVRHSTMQIKAVPPGSIRIQNAGSYKFIRFLK